MKKHSAIGFCLIIYNNSVYTAFIGIVYKPWTTGGNMLKMNNWLCTHMMNAENLCLVYLLILDTTLQNSSPDPRIRSQLL